MNTIGAFEAKTHLSELLARVGSGESFVITKRGKAVAHLSPVHKPAKGPKEIIEEFRRKHASALRPLSVAEINRFKSAGRK